MKPVRLSRRAMLRGAGGVAVGLPFMEIMTSSRPAQAATPKRYITFFSPNGTIQSAWMPQGTETSFTMPRILAPLAANQANLVVLTGLNNVVGSGKGPGDAHMRGMGAMLTGTELQRGTLQGGRGDPAGLGGGISVDQAIANGIGTNTKFKSLELGIQSRGGGTVWGYSSYTGPNQPLPPDRDPASVFNRVFGALGTNNTDLMRIQSERKSVLDAVIQSYAKLAVKLGSTDKAKLDEHVTNIRDLETRITAPGTESMGGVCAKPASPTIDPLANDNFPQVGRLQTDMLVRAMACDLTRVGTLQWEWSVGQVRHTWADPSINRGHHDISHDGDNNADSQEKLTKINVWYAQQFNYLLESLKAIPEGTGTMLDNTMILWCNELSRGNVHSHAPMHYVMAGKAGGALRTGRFLKYNNESHNNMLVSMLNVMGIPATTFGNPEYCTGPLPGLA